MEKAVEHSREWMFGEQRVRPAQSGSRLDAVSYFCRLMVEGHVSTWRHSRRVRVGSRLIAEKLGLATETIAIVEQAALLHDVGKLALHGVDIDKPGRFTDDEFALVRKHPELGHALIGAFPILANVIPAVLHHHERWDGKGYPHGLAGEEIPWMARVVAVADSYDAMTSIRPYRASMTHDDALGELAFHSGTQFDPLMVRAFASAVQTPL